MSAEAAHHRGAEAELGSALTLPDTVSASQAPPLPTPEPPSSGRWTAERLPVIAPSRYQIFGQIAQGGIGRVLRGWDEQMNRPVAIKELLDRGREAEVRFVREALLTSRLQHPSIVPVYDAGRWPTGAPFYAMKLVSGRSLAEVIAEAGALEHRLPLVPHVLAVAQAVAYAHAERIIHRDLKPANVLVGAFGETVVIDWGLAKELPESVSGARPSIAPPPLGPGDAAPPGDAIPPAPRAPRAPHVSDAPRPASPPRDTALTIAGAVVGTPGYMPPEQAAGMPVDERADVYALGAILYHALAGAPPHEGRTPGEILMRVLAGPPPPLAARQKGIPEDLLAIVEKAMARRPDDRYPTAWELADDLGRFQAGQLVAAHRYSPRELAARFARRHRAPLGVGAAALLVLLGVGTWAVAQVLSARDRAEAGRYDAERARGAAEGASRRAVDRADELTLMQARAALDRDPSEALTWLRSLSPSFQAWSAARTIAAEAQARGVSRALRGHEGVINSIAFSPDGDTLYSASDDRTVRLWDVRGGGFRAVTGHADEVWSVRLSPDGKRLVTGSKDRTIRVWDLDSGDVQQLHGHAGPVMDALFSPDGRRVLSWSDNAEVFSWDIATGEGRLVVAGFELAARAALSPDARRVATMSRLGELAVHEVDTGARRDAPGPGVRVNTDYERLMGTSPMVFSPDGRLVAAGGEDGVLHVWDPDEREARSLRGHTGAITRVAFSPDGRLVATTSDDATLRLWDLATGAARAFQAHQGVATRICFSPDGRWVASAGTDHTARLFSVETGEPRVFAGAEDTVFALAFSPDSRVLAAASSDHTIRLFRVDAGPSRVLGRHEGKALALDVARDSARVATAGDDGLVRVWDPEVGELLTLAGHEGPVTRVAFSPDGELLATGGHDGVVRVWDELGHMTRAIEAGAGPILHLAFSPDGKRVAAAAADGAAYVAEVTAGAPRRDQRLQGHVGAVEAVAFSPDGRRLATAGQDRTVRLWDLETGAGRILGEHLDRATAVAFSPDGAQLASGSIDHTLRLWPVGGDALTAAHPINPRVNDASGYRVDDLEFSPEGDALLFVGGVSAVRLWDPREGTPRRFLRGHEGVAVRAHLSRDGRSAVSASVDGTVRLWDLGTGEAQVFRGHAGAVRDARFLGEGRGLVSIGDDGTVRVWPDEIPHDPAALRAWITSVADPAESPDR